jgi:hypothetical protein
MPCRTLRRECGAIGPAIVTLCLLRKFGYPNPSPDPYADILCSVPVVETQLRTVILTSEAWGATTRYDASNRPSVSHNRGPASPAVNLRSVSLPLALSSQSEAYPLHRTIDTVLASALTPSISARLMTRIKVSTAHRPFWIDCQGTPISLRSNLKNKGISLCSFLNVSYHCALCDEGLV